MRSVPVRSLTRSTLVLAALLAGAGKAQAGDCYVDAVNGSNLNRGGSPASAWRTISFAMQNAPDPAPGDAQVVHVAPGVYDTALGEVFPIEMRSDFRIVGAGRDATILDGGGAGTLIQALWRVHFGIGELTGPATAVEGLTLRNAESGAVIDTTGPGMYLTLRDVRITQMSGAGYRSTTGYYGGIAGQAVSTLEAVEVDAAAVGVELQEPSFPGAPSTASSLTLRGCGIHDNAGTGLLVDVQDRSGGTQVDLLRTRIASNGGDALSLHLRAGVFSTQLHAVLSDCLLDRNAGAGLRVQAYDGGLSGTVLSLALERCTIADNTAEGLSLVDTTPSFFGTVVAATLQGTILHGNADDVLDDPARPMVASAAYCDVGDGDFAGSNGNIAADPLFADRLAGDYRLRFGSPCAESGDPLAPGTQDLLGLPRPLDGDLDLLAAPDMGAHELAPLFAAGAPHVGTALPLELWGPASAPAALYAARGALVAHPFATPFGDFLLPRYVTTTYAQTRADPGPPHVLLFPLPVGANWVGRKLSFQALIDSPAAPASRAFSNPVEVTLLP